MSLMAYCEKSSNGIQKYHCPIKCFKCIIEIGMIKKEMEIFENKQKSHIHG